MVKKTIRACKRQQLFTLTSVAAIGLTLETLFLPSTAFGAETMTDLARTLIDENQRYSELIANVSYKLVESITSEDGSVRTGRATVFRRGTDYWFSKEQDANWGQHAKHVIAFRSDEAFGFRQFAPVVPPQVFTYKNAGVKGQNQLADVMARTMPPFDPLSATKGNFHETFSQLLSKNFKTRRWDAVPTVIPNVYQIKEWIGTGTNPVTVYTVDRNKGSLCTRVEVLLRDGNINRDTQTTLKFISEGTATGFWFPVAVRRSMNEGKAKPVQIYDIQVSAIRALQPSSAQLFTVKGLEVKSDEVVSVVPKGIGPARAHKLIDDILVPIEFTTSTNAVASSDKDGVLSATSGKGIAPLAASAPVARKRKWIAGFVLSGVLFGCITFALLRSYRRSNHQ